MTPGNASSSVDETKVATCCRVSRRPDPYRVRPRKGAVLPRRCAVRPLIAGLGAGAIALGCGGQTAQNQAVDASASTSGDSSGPKQEQDAGVCTPGATRCFDNAVQTCASSGQWGAAVPCPGDSTACAGGACSQTPASCQGGGDGLTNGGRDAESCCTTLTVTGGTYYRTYDPLVLTDGGMGFAVTLAPDGGPADEANPAAVSTFALDKYDVTVGRFRGFVAAWNNGYGYVPPAGSGKHIHLNAGKGLLNSGGHDAYEPGWLATDDADIQPTTMNLSAASCGTDLATWSEAPGAQEALPINCITWQEAYAFCIWDGGFLPSEAEWVYAAAGGSEQREYPWGSTDPGPNYSFAIYDCYYPNDMAYVTGLGCPSGDPLAPVGTAPAGAGEWGQLDLAGNVATWALDWQATYVNPCSDCAYLKTASGRTCPGSTFATDSANLSPPARSAMPPWYRRDDVGIRCARAP
jgi:formylglycine-generating enzyme